MRTETQKTRASTRTNPASAQRSSTPGYSHIVLRLQQQLGNQAVQRFLHPRGIQAKLTVGAHNDKYEQEAGRVADQVMRMPESKVQRQTESEEEEEEPKITAELAHSNRPIKGSGQALPASERAFFEPRFGTDFSHVRIHTNKHAVRTARSINARAFTLGHDVVFGAGQYSSGTYSGRRLLAHELVHVVQQGRRSVALQPSLSLITHDSSGQVRPDKNKKRRKRRASTGNVWRKFLDRLNRVLWRHYNARVIAGGRLERRIIKKFDLAWIDKLPSFLKNQIDGNYAASREHRLIRRIARKEYKKYLNALWRKRKQAATQWRNRLKLAAYRRREWTRISKRVARIPVAPNWWLKESLLNTAKLKAVPSWGRIVARIDFMSSFTGVFGSSQALKKYFRGVALTRVPGSVYLCREAARRMNLVVSEFKKRFAGVDFPRSYTSLQIRGRHQQRHSRGMLGHPLGLSVDFFGRDNPQRHSKYTSLLLATVGAGPTYVALSSAKGKEYSYSARRRIIARMGRKSATGKALSQSEKKLLTAIRKAYRKVAATSRRFKAILTQKQKKQLLALAKHYWKSRREIIGLRGRIKVRRKEIVRSRKYYLRRISYRLKKALAKTRTAVRTNKRRISLYQKRLGRLTKQSKKSRKTLRQIGKFTRRLNANRQSLKRNNNKLHQYQLQQKNIHRLVESQPYIKKKKSEVRLYEGRLNNLTHPLVKKLPQVLKPMTDKIDLKIKSLLSKAGRYKSLPPHKQIVQTKRDVARYFSWKRHYSAWQRRKIRQTISRVQQLFPKHNAQNIKNMISLLSAGKNRDIRKALMAMRKFYMPLLVRQLKAYKKYTALNKTVGQLTTLRRILLTNYAFLFGTVHQRRRHSIKTVDPSILQLLQRGFARQDPMKARAKATATTVTRRRKRAYKPPPAGVFNDQFVALMAEYGFDPGATWSGSTDIMHFDFIEGFNRIPRGVSFGPTGVRAKRRRRRRK